MGEYARVRSNSLSVFSDRMEENARVSFNSPSGFFVKMEDSSCVFRVIILNGKFSSIQLLLVLQIDE